MGKFVAAFAVICREVSYNAQLTLDTFQILSFDVIIDCKVIYQINWTLTPPQATIASNAKRFKFAIALPVPVLSLEKEGGRC